MKHMDGYWNLKEIGLVLVHYWRRFGFREDFASLRGRTDEWMEGKGREATGMDD
jgi:hypothetical protein